MTWQLLHWTTHLIPFCSRSLYQFTLLSSLLNFHLAPIKLFFYCYSENKLLFYVFFSSFFSQTQLSSVLHWAQTNHDFLKDTNAWTNTIDFSRSLLNGLLYFLTFHLSLLGIRTLSDRQRIYFHDFFFLLPNKYINISLILPYGADFQHIQSVTDRIWLDLSNLNKRKISKFIHMLFLSIPFFLLE